jgi:hypothetical protein
MNEPTTITIELPDGLTMGDITSARGAIIEASTNYVDWEKLYNNNDPERHHVTSDPISAPGMLLLAVAHQLGKVKD